MRWPVIWLGLSLGLVGCRPSDSPAQTQTATSPPVAIPRAPEEIRFPVVAQEPPVAEVDPGLNLPAAFTQRVQDRAFLDRMGVQLHQLAVTTVPGPQLYARQNRFSPESIRMVRDTPPPAQLDYWRALPKDFTPLRGYRAPITDEAPLWPASENSTGEENRRLAALVHEALAEEGLMSTLARAVDLVGAERCVQQTAAVVEELRQVGFPVDLIEHFSGGDKSLDAVGCVRKLGASLAGGARLESLTCELGLAPADFGRGSGQFMAAEESGGTKLGLLRMQLGGGYRDGVVPGGALDIMTQLAAALPKVNFLVSVPAEYATDFRRLVRDFWPLQRPNHVTITVEPLPLASWAQDNGKAGILRGRGAPATLVPRYATQDEVSFRFLPGESLLARGLQAAGHAVIQSPLLFQGGNLLVVRDPVRDQRILLVGEAEVQRNRALGLTAQQALEAFKAEFGVDECLVLPPVSFHLDYDLTLRQHQGRLIVFVNDSLSAARLVLSRGLRALQQNGLATADVAAGIQASLSEGRWPQVYTAIWDIVSASRNGAGQYSDQLIQVFTDGPADAPGANFRCFLTALDLVASRAWTQESCPAPASYARYLGALRRMEEGAQAQRHRLEEQGWTVASVPSMPDLEASVNYLNGIQEKDCYLMPVYGGFYRSVDQVAMEVFRGVLGGQVKIVPIRSAGAQRRHGAVHCTAAAYPALP